VKKEKRKSERGGGILCWVEEMSKRQVRLVNMEVAKFVRCSTSTFPRLLEGESKASSR
jgi:hypothetical protein